MRKAGLARATEFTWARTASITLDAYRQVAAGSRTTMSSAPDLVDRDRQLERPAVSRAVSERRRRAAGRRRRDDPRRQRVDRRHRRVRPRAVSVGAPGRARPRIAALPAATTPARARRAAGSSCFSTTTPCRSQAGSRRCCAAEKPAGLTRSPPRGSSTCTIRASSTAPATGCCAGAARSSGITARAPRRPRSRGEVFGVCGAACVIPRTRVRGARRIRRGLLRLARGRRSVVSRAAARLLVPLRRRRGRASSRQRDARTRRARLRSSTVSATSSGCISRTRRRRCCCERCPGHLIYTAAAAVHFARHGSARRVPPREVGGARRACRVSCASARRCSARGASAAARSGRTSSRAGWRPSGARSGSIWAWPETSGDARARRRGAGRRHRQLQRRGRAARRAAIDRRRDGAARSDEHGKAVASCRQCLDGRQQRRSPGSLPRTPACCGTRSTSDSAAVSIRGWPRRARRSS